MSEPNQSDQMVQDLIAYLREVEVHGRPLTPGAVKYARAVYTLAKATGASGIFYDPDVLHDDGWAVLEGGEEVSNQPTYLDGARMVEWRAGGYKRYQEAERAKRLDVEIQRLQMENSALRAALAESQQANNNRTRKEAAK